MTARKLRGPDDATETDDRILRIAYTPTGQVDRVTLPDGTYTTYSYTQITAAVFGASDAAGGLPPPPGSIPIEPFILPSP